MPRAPGPGSGNALAPSASTGAPQPPFPRWRMDWERNYKHCPGKAIQHILCRHGAASKQPGGKFYTNSAREVRGLIRTAMKRGERVWDSDGGVWRVTYRFGEKIG